MNRLTPITLCLISLAQPGVTAMNRHDNGNGAEQHQGHLPSATTSGGDNGGNAGQRARRNSFTGFPLGGPETYPGHPLTRWGRPPAHANAQVGLWQRTRNLWMQVTPDPEYQPAIQPPEARTLLDVQANRFSELAAQALTPETYTQTARPIIQECDRLRGHFAHLQERLSFNVAAPHIRCALAELIRRIDQETTTARELIVSLEPQPVPEPAIQPSMLRRAWNGFWRGIDLTLDHAGDNSRPILTPDQRRSTDAIRAFNHAQELYKKAAIVAAEALPTHLAPETPGWRQAEGVQEAVDPEVEAAHLRNLDDDELALYLRQVLADNFERCADISEFRNLARNNPQESAAGSRLWAKIFQAATFGASAAEDCGEGVERGYVQNLLRFGLQGADHAKELVTGESPFRRYLRQQIDVDHGSNGVARFTRYADRYKRWIDRPVEKLTGHNVAHWIDPETTVIPGAPAPGYGKLNLATLLRWSGNITKRVAGWAGRKLDFCSKKLYTLARRQEQLPLSSVSAILQDLAQAYRPGEHLEMAMVAEAAPAALGAGLPELPVDDLYEQRAMAVAAGAPAPHPDDSDGEDDSDRSSDIDDDKFYECVESEEAAAHVAAQQEVPAAMAAQNVAPVTVVLAGEAGARGVAHEDGENHPVVVVNASQPIDQQNQPLMEQRQPQAVVRQEVQREDLHWFQKGLRVTSKFSGLLVVAIALLAIVYNS